MLNITTTYTSYNYCRISKPLQSWEGLNPRVDHLPLTERMKGVVSCPDKTNNNNLELRKLTEISETAKCRIELWLSVDSLAPRPRESAGVHCYKIQADLFAVINGC